VPQVGNDAVISAAFRGRLPFPWHCRSWW